MNEALKDERRFNADDINLRNWEGFRKILFKGEINCEACLMMLPEGFKISSPYGDYGMIETGDPGDYLVIFSTGMKMIVKKEDFFKNCQFKDEMVESEKQLDMLGRRNVEKNIPVELEHGPKIIINHRSEEEASCGFASRLVAFMTNDNGEEFLGYYCLTNFAKMEKE